MKPLTRILNAVEAGHKSDACKMGYDCGLNGANTTNSHFGIFSSKERTKEWERGCKDGEKAKIEPKP